MESIGFMIFVLFITQSLQTCTVYACEMFLVSIALCIYEFVCLLKQLITLLPTVTLTYMLGISGRKFHAVVLRISTMNLEIVVVQSLSCVQLFTTPGAAAWQVSLSFTISWSLLKIMFIESVMPSNIPSSVALFSSSPQSFPSSVSFLMSQLFTSGGQSVGASASVLSMNTQGWFPLGLTGFISLQSKGLSWRFSSTEVQKDQIFGTQPSLWSKSHICAWLLEKP